MGRKRREESEKEPLGEIQEVAKRVKKETTSLNANSEKPKKANNVNEKTKGVSGVETRDKKIGACSDVTKNLNKDKVYTDSSSSSDSESERNSAKVEKRSATESNSDSDSDSFDSDSSPTSREETEKEKCEKPRDAANEKNAVTNLVPVKSYVPPPKTSSSDSYHSDTEEEDKKRRKKQKKLLQMQLNKKAKKILPRSQEAKQDSDADDEGADNIAANNDGVPEWPESDYAELIRRMEAQIPAKDNQKFDSRAAKLDWSKIAFGDYSPEDCMEVWLGISKRIRRFRTLHEILQDAREWITKPWTNFYRGSKKNRHPDMPPRPLSTYMIYYLEQKDKVAKENPGLEMTQAHKDLCWELFGLGLYCSQKPRFTPEYLALHTCKAATEALWFAILTAPEPKSVKQSSF